MRRPAIIVSFDSLLDEEGKDHDVSTIQASEPGIESDLSVFLSETRYHLSSDPVYSHAMSLLHIMSHNL